MTRAVMSAPEPGGKPEMTRTALDGYGCDCAAVMPSRSAITTVTYFMCPASPDAFQDVQAAHAVEQVNQPAFVDGNVVALHALGSLRDVRHEISHLPHCMRAGHVDDPQPPCEPRDRDLGPGDEALRGLVAAGHVRLRLVGHFLDLVGRDHLRVAFVGDIHHPQESRGMRRTAFEPAHVLV